MEKVSGNIHSSYNTRADAESAWYLANAVGTVRRLFKDGRAACILPTDFPEELMREFMDFPDIEGREWYVVTKGRRPGVYPSW